MDLQDSVKDYKLPVEESGWEAIAQDSQLVRFNRRKRLQRMCLYGAAPVLVAAAVVAAVLFATSSKKSKDVPAQPDAPQKVVVQQTVPAAQQSQEAVLPVSDAAPAQTQTQTSQSSNSPSLPVLEESSTVATQPVAQTSVPSAPLTAKVEKRASVASTSPAPESKPVKSTPVTSAKSQDNNENSYEEPETPADIYQLFIPNAFTPNGDGINDLFKVEADFTPLSFEIAIYSRRGELVFLNKDIKLGWDGAFRGKELPGEIYNYVVKFTDPDGKQSIRRGQVTLIR